MLDKNQIFMIEDTLRNSLRSKFLNYKPEPSVMPFHTRLLGQDRLALYSFIQSLNTTFGTSIYEPVAKNIGSILYASALTQQTAGDKISSEAHLVIQDIMDGLDTVTLKPDKQSEIAAIRQVCNSGIMKSVKPTKVDLKLISTDGTIYLMDIKTAKPNVGDFKKFKRTMLEWVAAILAIDPKANVQTFIAIPYNPYEPKPYSRWTIGGMLDLAYELKVAAEFWDFLGGEGTYDELLNIFERVGIELRPEIDEYFQRF